MSLESSKTQMRKGLLEYGILLVLSKHESYPSDIISELKVAGLDLPEGTLYPLLTRLKNDGILQYRWEESSMGPPRKYFSLTPKGQDFLKELASAWDDITSAINFLKTKLSNKQ